MKHLFKKICSIFIITISIVASLFFCSCGEKKNIQSFYDYAITAKTTLDNLAEETDTFLYTITYNPSGINLSVYTNISSSILKQKRAEVQSDYDTLSKLLADTKESSLHLEAKAVFYAFEDYASYIFDPNDSYKTFTSKKNLYEKELRNALLELERAI